ncbi:RdgB/HAM1 family non-canonical purine NTP pyrophosphatase [Kiloniella sp. b19]|uniref:RdgB/HAM1 family non-canonical purine NTP pyrophosphatase n=1 Tax=Kiloniella sp. GXU_MW_B19 TaxID=3141326 RepID=UPI0031D0EBAE
MTRPIGEKLVIATHNAGKLREIQALMQPHGIAVVSAGELDLPEPEETGLTFAANAEIKAVAATKASGLPALADDSGLAVAALDGAPGIYSARWAGPQKDFGLAMSKVQDALEQAARKGNEDRSAAFVCSLCLAMPDGAVRFFEGRVEGEIVWPLRGEGGFGYDPVFQPEGESRTFGEMPSEDKQSMSHRGRAFEQMVQKLFG